MVKQKDFFCCNATTCFLIVLLSVMSGCATTLSPAAAKIREVGKENVSECKYLGEVTGSSQVGSQIDEAYHTGEDRAQSEAKEKAAQLGATHIVWRKFIKGTPVFVIGDAYLCGETTR